MISLHNWVTVLLYFSVLVQSATVTYDFNVTWTTANPDGKAQRRTIGINNQWPIPIIRVNKGDRLVVNTFNGLGDEPTSLHFHGLFQNGTNYMDGPVAATQCAIAPGQKFTYDFVVDQPGTYWYHSHSKGQYPDGLRGALIVNDPDDPHKSLYDEEIILTLSDWYHESMKTLNQKFISVTNPTGAEPVPDSALMNDSQDIKLALKPGKTYLVRIINMAAFAAQYLWFEGHTMRVVEVDGVYTKPMEAERLYITAAQRYSVLLTAKNDTSQNYAFVGSMDEDLFDKVPPSLNPNVTGWLVYDSSKPNPEPTQVDNFDHLDDFLLEPHDGSKRLEDPDCSITLTVSMNNLGDGANYAFFNNITYVHPKVPTLYTLLQAPDNVVTNPKIYGTNTHALILEHNKVVEIVINNDDPGKHPFHLHGHNFQLVYRSDEDAGSYDPLANSSMPAIPMRRDTVLVRPNGNMVLRFYSDNPGVWLFHCHIEWHVTSGLTATFIESPIEVRERIKIPESHYRQCEAAGYQYQGNAAGNTRDYLNLKGENLPPEPLSSG